MFAISYPYLEYWKNWNIGRFLSLGGLHVSIFSSHGVFFLTSSLRTPKFFVKEFCYFLMSCHQHCLGINLLVQR